MSKNTSKSVRSKTNAYFW